jgi:hypothetical protein
VADTVTGVLDSVLFILLVLAFAAIAGGCAYAAYRLFPRSR